MGVDGMANEEQAVQSKADIEWWGDLDKQMKDVKQREAINNAVLGKELFVTHGATGPWYAWQSPTGEWFEGDKVFWAYDFHTDDLFGTIFGNPLSQFLIGAFMGCRGQTHRTDYAMANVTVNMANNPVAAVEKAEIEGLFKAPKKTPKTMVYDADGKLKGMYVFEDFPKDGILPGAYPGMTGGAGGLDGAYGGHCDEECEFVQDLSKKVQELEAYAGVPGAEA